MLVTRVAITVLVLSVSSRSLNAQATVASTIPRYPGIKTQFNRSLSEALTNEHRLELYRQTVPQGRYSGQPMLTRMFGNFAPESFNLSPTTPGLSTTVRVLASDNRNVVKEGTR